MRKTMIKALQHLIAGKALIDTPEKWGKQKFAMNAEGEEVDLQGDDVCKFCSAGALSRAIYDHDKRNGVTSHRLVRAAEFTRAMDVLESQITDHAWRIYEESINNMTYFNDSHTHAEVMALWDSAIAKVSSQLDKKEIPHEDKGFVGGRFRTI